MMLLQWKRRSFYNKLWGKNEINFARNSFKKCYYYKPHKWIYHKIKTVFSNIIILHCLKPTIIVGFRRNHVSTFTVDTQGKIINRMRHKYYISINLCSNLYYGLVRDEIVRVKGFEALVKWNKKKKSSLLAILTNFLCNIWQLNTHILTQLWL